MRNFLNLISSHKGPKILIAEFSKEMTQARKQWNIGRKLQPTQPKDAY